MPGPVEHRSATPIIKFIQEFIRGRKVVLHHRHADNQAKRTQPPPTIPGGPYHKTSQIYYYTRDARREVVPPMIISGSKQIGTESMPSVEKKFSTPGKTYNWDA